MGSNSREPDGWSRAVAAQIRAERAACGLTQTQVFTRARMPRSTYIRVETGERVGDVIQLSAISRALGIRLVTLIERAEERMQGASVL